MRSAQSQAKNAANTAGSTSGSLMGEGQAIQSNLTPMLTGELTAEHSLDPTQLNEMMTYADAGTGGATSAFTGQAELEAARTGQGGPSSSLLDSLARGKQQAAAKTSEGVAAQDVEGALKNRQIAAQQLGQMGEADTSDALKAMGLQAQDIGEEVQAGNSGWFQNMTGLMKSLSGAGTSKFKV